ncbi:ABC transporter substrate-binding protein [Methanoplanus endosymbiosus]|uniref:NrtA/SsuA/CpmA family ABC transporter substrate-binding protein n=1 Tax=Methanoplanus endosymbiosus TaxID=33865 RepID=A0A9E7PPX4_9EURY|nr:NrtA/SsuA/CpmA family ABC transporter substrate-binding protein [Methanoplanus endosymbiosus]UUX93287.1 NrtA/SsuA/CpmA family ABC transporter substrate-binding protein [Methanoplanus endosymbiosus]
MDETKKPADRTSLKPAVIVIAAVIILVVPVIYFMAQTLMPPEHSEPLIIATGPPYLSALTLIADENGYFEKYGLNVTLIETPTGNDAVRKLLAGTADLAYAAEYVGVKNSFDAPDLRIIASTMKADIVSVIVRSDRDISVPSDLKGKTIALYKGTIADYYFGKFLAANGIDPTEVNIVYLTPEEVAESIISGDADAAVIWQPFVSQIERQLAGDSITWSVQGGQRYYRLTFVMEETIHDRPGVLRDYLRAIDDAETFLHAHEPEAREIVGQRANKTYEELGTIWGNNWFVLSLDQGLIPTMEDEARWMAEQNMTGGKTPPSYLDMIYQDAMLEVKPSAVTVIG